MRVVAVNGKKGCVIIIAVGFIGLMAEIEARL